MHIHSKTQWQGIPTKPNIQVDGKKPQEPKDMHVTGISVEGKQKEGIGCLMNLKTRKLQNSQ